MTTLDSGCILKSLYSSKNCVHTYKYQHYNGGNWGHTRIYPAAVSHADQMRESRNTLNVAPGLTGTHFACIHDIIFYMFISSCTQNHCEEQWSISVYFYELEIYCKPTHFTAYSLPMDWYDNFVFQGKTWERRKTQIACFNSTTNQI